MNPVSDIQVFEIKSVLVIDNLQVKKTLIKRVFVVVVVLGETNISLQFLFFGLFGVVLFVSCCLVVAVGFCVVGWLVGFFCFVFVFCFVLLFCFCFVLLLLLLFFFFGGGS